MLRDEIAPYVDADGLVCPRLVALGEREASGNGVMYTAEYYILNAMSGDTRYYDFVDFKTVMRRCTVEPGLLKRTPSNSQGQEGPDDYYGFLAACSVLCLYDTGATVLDYGLKHWGNYNNVEPGRFTKSSFLFRQPQLVAAMYAAAGRPVPFLLSLYAALAIAVSCINTPTGDTDSRRLAWLLIQTMRGKSFFMNVAERIWLKRLRRDYPNGMRDVAAIYYGASHPFAKYWTDK